MRRRELGFSLSEILLTGGLFLLLTLMLVTGWTHGSRAWRTASERNEILGQAQRFLRLTERELEATSSLGIDQSPESQMLSYASTFTVDDPSTFETEASSGALNWPKQVLIYLDSSQRLIYRKELSVPTDHAAYRTPTPLSKLNLGAGMRPLSDYANNGNVVARRVTSLLFSLEKRSVIITLLLETEQGREAHFESTTLLRNSQ